MCPISVSSDGPFCRICHEGANGESLLSPCGCTGTLGAVHKSCLERWLSSSNTSYCELCHTEFAVEKRSRSLTEVRLGAGGRSWAKGGRQTWGRRRKWPWRILVGWRSSFSKGRTLSPLPRATSADGGGTGPEVPDLTAPVHLPCLVTSGDLRAET